MTALYLLSFSLFFGVNNELPDTKPEELALEFFVDSLINKPLFTFNQEEYGDKPIIYLKPLIPEKIYINGFLNGFKLYTEGLAYGFPYAVAPSPMTNEEYKEFGYSKPETKRFERLIKASSENSSNPIFNDTTKIKVPNLIQVISLNEDKNLIQEDSSIYIRIYKALETEKEYLVQLNLYEKFADVTHNAGGFMLVFIINKKNKIVEWDTAGSYY